MIVLPESNAFAAGNDLWVGEVFLEVPDLNGVVDVVDMSAMRKSRSYINKSVQSVREVSDAPSFISFCHRSTVPQPDDSIDTPSFSPGA